MPEKSQSMWEESDELSMYDAHAGPSVPERRSTRNGTPILDKAANAGLSRRGKAAEAVPVSVPQKRKRKVDKEAPVVAPRGSAASKVGIFISISLYGAS